MKNMSCLKLNINRSKAPKKMGTLKDISLFGSFAFPMDGEYASGLVAQSLAGVGKMVKKTKVQVKKLASRESCLAGATGSSISSELPEPLERQSAVSIQPQDVYTIRFINHAPETVLAPTLDNVPRPSSFPSPPSGFALKKNSGKKTVFSLAQKEIMMLFYNRQATGGMRADPKDVIACMRERGVEVLKEQQIRSWWSMYHQKRKRSLNALTNDACNPTSQQHPVQPPSVSAHACIPATLGCHYVCTPATLRSCSSSTSSHFACIPATLSSRNSIDGYHCTWKPATFRSCSSSASSNYACIPATLRSHNSRNGRHYACIPATLRSYSSSASSYYACIPATLRSCSSSASSHYTCISATLRSHNSRDGHHYACIPATLRSCSSSASSHYACIPATLSSRNSSDGCHYAYIPANLSSRNPSDGCPQAYKPATLSSRNASVGFICTCSTSVYTVVHYFTFCFIKYFSVIFPTMESKTHIKRNQ
ncbi:unnamed protein product [Pocillopora meandrina]|uniref:Homeobox domain-containing protein n=1 Tax=Pocillopora meandrina TaxID=46732 RepID=A0AAU9WMF2_9CNID|nr:unnamed protein product [Pocillopora meandrina]